MRRFLPLLFFLFAAMPAAAVDLLMMEEDGCMWCARWEREIGPIYDKTPEGRFAPIRHLDIRAPLPADIRLARPAVFTPTFILVDEGREIARIEGYPGEDFFWGLLGKLLKENTRYQGAGS